MAQSKAVLAVLATAVALAGTIENEDLNASIEALKAETDANGNTQECKDLKALVEKINDGRPAKPKKLKYISIRMIGNKYYSDKDKYKKSFGTADECAEHFNG